ncbi:LAMI_0E06414g1_1 [Lachancea mirantina]|uniref:Nucleolar protein SWM2 n=1 Tax=Lachancea mirantina TaxID=1230905 RepID=A0A1G4JLT1_9SACH|nr:LAMI_0E06414g1_1 [Lachancea mirantina]
MSTFSIPLLQQFVDNFTQLELIPASFTPILDPYYTEIAKNQELKDRASEICNAVLKDYQNYNPEIVKRCSRFHGVLAQSQQNPRLDNLIIEDIDVTASKFSQFTDDREHMGNLIVEEIDVEQFV